MSHIFISHSSRDGRDHAQSLVTELEAAGRRCWIAPRNMKPAVPFPEQIVDAISNSRGLILVLTPEANQSLDVLQEVVQAHHERKLIAAVILSGTEPSKNLIYYLRVRQQLVWTEATEVAAALGQVFAPLEDRPSLAPVARYGESFKDWPEGPELVMIPPGSFLMGSPEGEEGHIDYEGPVHKVAIGYPFAVGKYPVTRGQWRQFAQATGYKSDEWLEPGFQQEDSHPVVCITWQDAVDYAAWLRQKTGHAYRLLSEAEAEYINRAGSQTAYFWGENAADMPLYTHKRSKDFELQGTWPVGRFKANAFGLHDTVGHVLCWTQDRWHPGYHGAPADGSAWEEGTNTGRVVRGGSWANAPRGLRSANRGGFEADFGDSTQGFRVAWTAG